MANYNIQTMLKQVGGPVSISSVLIPLVAVKEETVDAVRNATIASAVNKASELWGPAQALTVRDLTGTDMGYPTNDMTETSNGGAAAWNAMTNCNAFAVPTATVIGIYGIMLSYKPDATILQMPITGIRIDVGGSRRAQWNIQTLDQFEHAAGTAAYTPKAGITKSPIIVAEDITVTIYEYTRTATTVYKCVWLGVAVEKQGVTLKP